MRCGRPTNLRIVNLHRCKGRVEFGLDNPSFLLQRPRTPRDLHPVARLRQCTQPSRPIPCCTLAKCPLLLDGHLPNLTMTMKDPICLSKTVGGHQPTLTSFSER